MRIQANTWIRSFLLCFDNSPYARARSLRVRGTQVPDGGQVEFKGDKLDREKISWAADFVISRYHSHVTASPMAAALVPALSTAAVATGL